MTKRTYWYCDRCEAAFEYSDDWGEQPISYVACAGPPRKVDLCAACMAQLERFLAGTPLVNPPAEQVGAVQGTAAVRKKVNVLFRQAVPTVPPEIVAKGEDAVEQYVDCSDCNVNRTCEASHVREQALDSCNVHVHISPSESEIPTETEHPPLDQPDEELLDYDRLAGPH